MSKRGKGGYDKFMLSILKVTQSYIEEASQYHREQFEDAFTNHLLDLSGPRRVRRTLSPRERFAARLWDGFVEIQSSFDSLRDVEIYIGRFPFVKTTITKPRYLRYNIEAYLHEVYILKERLNAYLTLIGRLYRGDKRYPIILDTTKQMRKHVSDSFRNLISIRGRHSHEARFRDENVARLDLMELLASNREDDEFIAMVTKYYNAEYKRIRSYWKQTISKNNEKTKETLDSYFSILHLIIFNPNGELLYPPM